MGKLFQCDLRIKGGNILSIMITKWNILRQHNQQYNAFLYVIILLSTNAYFRAESLWCHQTIKTANHRSLLHLWLLNRVLSKFLFWKIQKNKKTNLWPAVQCYPFRALFLGAVHQLKEQKKSLISFSVLWSLFFPQKLVLVFFVHFSPLVEQYSECPQRWNWNYRLVLIFINHSPPPTPLFFFYSLPSLLQSFFSLCQLSALAECRTGQTTVMAAAE